MFCLNAHNLITIFNNIKNYSNSKYRSSYFLFGKVIDSIINKKVIEASDEERRKNSRARSAKLRILEKL